MHEAKRSNTLAGALHNIVWSSNQYHTPAPHGFVKMMCSCKRPLCSQLTSSVFRHVRVPSTQVNGTIGFKSNAQFIPADVATCNGAHDLRSCLRCPWHGMNTHLHVTVLDAIVDHLDIVAATTIANVHHTRPIVHLQSESKPVNMPSSVQQQQKRKQYQTRSPSFCRLM